MPVSGGETCIACGRDHPYCSVHSSINSGTKIVNLVDIVARKRSSLILLISKCANALASLKCTHTQARMHTHTHTHTYRCNNGQ